MILFTKQIYIANKHMDTKEEEGDELGDWHIYIIDTMYIK